MKRLANSRNDGNDDDTNRSRTRRRFLLDDSVSHAEPIGSANTGDWQSDHTTNDGFASLHEANDESEKILASQHTIENLGENVSLTDYVKKHSNTLTFPEKLMITLSHVERECVKSERLQSSQSIGWVLNGKAFVVRNIDQFCETLLPIFFGQAKFSSFTRKLYRWGFRKINIVSIPNRSAFPDSALFFGNAHFLRDDKSQLSLMKSVTAAKTRTGVAADASKQSWRPPENGLSEKGKAKPQVRQSIPHPANSSTTYHVPQPNPTEPLGENTAALMQQAANLAALNSLLQSRSQVDPVTYQPLAYNPIMDENLRRLLIPFQIPLAQTIEMSRTSQQLALSAALTASGLTNLWLPQAHTQASLSPQNLGTGSPGTNSNIQTTQPNVAIQSRHQGWSPEELSSPEIRLQDPVSQNLVDERLRGVINAFLQYCQLVQQQRNSAQDPSSDQKQPPREPP